MTKTYDELSDALLLQGYAPEVVKVRDARYAVMPSKEFIFEVFAKTFEQWKTANGLIEYVPEEFDCEDYSDAAVLFAKIAHRRSPGRPPRSSPAIGTIDYNRDNGGRHVINLFLCADDWPVLRFFEPQTSGQVVLSDRERAIVNEIRF